MNEILNFIKDCGVYYLATVDGDKPRVRPYFLNLVRNLEQLNFK